jgi:hypothetical protein
MHAERLPAFTAVATDGDAMDNGGESNRGERTVPKGGSPEAIFRRFDIFTGLRNSGVKSVRLR